MKLELKDLSYRYNKKSSAAVNNFNCIFHDGDVTALMGASGSGKSTILMLLAGLDKNFSGQILLEDKDIRSINQNLYRARHVGVIFQNYNLLTHLSVIDNVKMGFYLSGEKNIPKDKAAQLLHSVGIMPDMHKKMCYEISGGEQQRVAIARALSGNPGIIIADEPTSNLDENNKNIIMDIFINLAKKESKCIIIATHEKETSSRADKIINL